MRPHNTEEKYAYSEPNYAHTQLLRHEFRNLTLRNISIAVSLSIFNMPGGMTCVSFVTHGTSKQSPRQPVIDECVVPTMSISQKTNLEKIGHVA